MGERRPFQQSFVEQVEDPSPVDEPVPTGDLVNINTATVEELDGLPGIGPTKAQAIVDYREQNGPFQSVDELLNVTGVGNSTLANIRNLVTVD